MNTPQHTEAKLSYNHRGLTLQVGKFKFEVNTAIPTRSRNWDIKFDMPREFLLLALHANPIDPA
jgi:hypothetical protein